MKTGRDLLVKLSKSIVRAHQAWRNAETDVELHRYDFSDDRSMERVLRASGAQKRLRRLLDQLEVVLKRGP